MGVILPLPVPFENVFPAGCFITSEVEPITDYVDGKPGAQSIDETTNFAHVVVQRGQARQPEEAVLPRMSLFAQVEFVQSKSDGSDVFPWKR